ncbi:ATP-binding protein [Streptomyces sp. OR43]|uniref:ATP-binding protein n=1 Tax=Streptomyces sp. or43 TaxID=2478957 RepID=UPI0011CE45BC|nr:ATP-binding protein [Streptomyces sp. or43]TXS36270.1 ATP-binding protein [Streptomyces sp. or43]
MSLSQQRRFPRRRTSVGASRDFVVDVLAEWRLTPLVDDIRLCVSELATNALLHGVPPGREFAVRLRANRDLVHLEVRDSGGGHPEVKCPTAEDCTGRGLLLVIELAADFGVDHHAVGKTVWAAFKRPATPPAT